MIRKIPLILAGMAASALAGLPLQGAARAVASGGAIWQIVPSPDPGTFPTLVAVGASSASDAWTVGHYANSTNSAYFSLAEHWNGSGWAVVPTPNPFGTENILTAVADLSPANAWAVGYSVDTSNYYNPVYQPLIEHWDGTGWTAVPAAADRNGLADVMSGDAAVSLARPLARVQRGRDGRPPGHARLLRRLGHGCPLDQRRVGGGHHAADSQGGSLPDPVGALERP